jgi:hypothetical protein
VIYLHEIVRSVPGQEEAYMTSVLSLRFAPQREGWPGNYGEFGQFRTVDTSGQGPLVVNIWEHTWESQCLALETQFQDGARDTTLEAWWNRSLHLRRGGHDRILIPAPWVRDRAALSEAGVRARVFLHEVLWLPFGQVPEYLDALGERFLPAARRFGCEAVGAVRVAMRPAQAVTLLACRDWENLAALLAARESDPELRAWFAYREGMVQRCEEHVMIPGRGTPLAPRA